MNEIHMKGAHSAPAGKSSRMDTLELTPAVMASWKPMPGQRLKKINAKVREIATQISQTSVVPGILTLGHIRGDPPGLIYLVDGQHRCEAAKLSGLEEGILADVRIMTFADYAEMGEEFVLLSSQIVRTTPDDSLRALEGSVPVIQNIRAGCPFVGFDNIRRSDRAPMLSMSTVCKCWMGSLGETPTLGFAITGGALGLVRSMSVDDAAALVKFLNIAMAAWGRDDSVHRLWGSSLNLGILMWMWRRLVLDQERAGTKRYVRLTPELYKKCLMSVSASHEYIDWLLGRKLTERDRSPCYGRLRKIFTARLRLEMNGTKKPFLPQPAWFVHSGQ